MAMPDRHPGVIGPLLSIHENICSISIVGLPEVVKPWLL